MKVYRYTVFIKDEWTYDAIIPERHVNHLKSLDKIETLIADYIIINEEHERDDVKVILDDIIKVDTMRRNFFRGSRNAFVFGDEQDYEQKHKH